MQHVIIGAGAAGLTAATTIRKNKPYDDIMVISVDEMIHSRSMIHKYLKKERTIEALNFTPTNFFENNHITWEKGQRVERIDATKKRVITRTSEFSYDKLLIASGAKTFIPDIGDLREAKNVFTFRSLEDARLIEDQMSVVEKIAIIGAGLVGLDVAYGLLDYQKEITMVEQATRIMPLQLDYRAANAYQKAFEAHNCQFYFNSIVTETILGADENIVGLRLHDGRIIPCDMVIMATGIEPNMNFVLENEAVKKDRYRILVNGYLQTSDPDIYAAGDVTRLSGIWPNARKQGEIAGKNMTEVYEPYVDYFAFKNNVNFFQIITLSIGEVIEKEGDQVYVKEDIHGYKKIVVRRGVVVTVIFQGDISNVGIWQYLVKHQVNISHMKKEIWNISFADFFGIEANGSYTWQENK